MSLKKSIKKTIEYAQKFGFELNSKELEERLISKKIFKEKEIIGFFDKNKKYKSLINIKNKNQWTKDKFQKAEKLAVLIEKKFENILFLGITGSVAANNTKEDDDIDLMIIAKKNTLWIIRLKLRWFIYSHKIAHRKYGNKQKKDEFCFNLWLDEGRLRLPKIKQNLRSAIDMILVKPIINKNETYEKFLLANHWAKRWVATGYNKIVDRRSLIVDKKAKFNLINWLVNFLVFVPQYLWMLPKIKKEKINLHQAFFHNN